MRAEDREYTDPAVLTAGVSEGWAEPVTDPTLIDWPARQAAALIPFDVVDGRPVSPGPASRVRRGRNGLGLWGENAMADALVTACTGAGARWLLLVERADGRGWAVPGGAIDRGESPMAAARRELAEETGLVVPAELWRSGEPRYVPDPRGSGEAWAVTVAAQADLGTVPMLPAVQGADDARRAAWVRAESFTGLEQALRDIYDGGVFPAHIDLLRDALSPDEGLREEGAGPLFAHLITRDDARDLIIRERSDTAWDLFLRWYGSWVQYQRADVDAFLARDITPYVTGAGQ